jgi:broad specificity phosphatase PhoE
MVEISPSNFATIYLVRHATPDWDHPKSLAYHVPPGPVLTRKGLEEAGRLAVYLQSIQITRLFSSPLERCLQTARFVSASAHVPLYVNDGIMEVQPRESGSHLLERIWPVFEQAYAESCKTGPVAIVTHGGVIHRFLRHLGMDPITVRLYSFFDHGNPAPPAGVWRVSGLIEDKYWQLKLIYRDHYKIESFL